MGLTQSKAEKTIQDMTLYKKEDSEEKHTENWGTSTSSQAWNLSGVVLEISSGSQVLNFKPLACNAVT